MAVIAGLTRLIEKEFKGEHNPVACAGEVIYTGPLKISNEIIIPRIGDLIQEIVIKCDKFNKNELPNISSAYIETKYYTYYNKVLVHEPIIKRWSLNIFQLSNCIKLICDYEVNLLRPYQDTKLVLVTDNSKLYLNGSKYSVSIMANYIFVDTNSRRKLFF